MAFTAWLEAKEDAALAVLRSRAVLRVATLAVGAAAVGRYVTAPGTPWHEHFGMIVGAGAALGIYTTVRT